MREFQDVVMHVPDEERAKTTPFAKHSYRQRADVGRIINDGGQKAFSPRRMRCCSFHTCLNKKVLAIFVCPTTGRKVQMNVAHRPVCDQMLASKDAAGDNTLETAPVFEEWRPGVIRLVEGESWAG